MSNNGNYGAFALALSDKLICERFWTHVRLTTPTDCWMWTANCAGRKQKNHPALSQHGQFTFSINGRQHHVYAHRFAWGTAHGPIPAGLQVLHRCDNPPCCNEQHLFLGTQADNLKDAAQKNRLTVPRTRALSLYDRLTIFHAPAYRGICVELAARYGVTKTCISLIRRGRFLGSGVWAGTKQPSFLFQSDAVERVIRWSEGA